MRLALRSLAKSPGFATAVVLTLALGIGANTAVFSVLRGVMLRPLPHRDGDRLLYLRQSAANTGQQDIWFSVPEIADIRAGAPSLAAVAEFSSLTFNLIGAGEPVQIQAGIVTGNFFEVMGLGAVVGRTLDARDDGPTAAPAMMLTDAYWRRAFAGDPAVIGRVLRVNGRSAEVVGVAEPAPAFPVENDVFVNMVVSPHHLDATMVTGRTHRMTSVFGRLAPGATPRQAQVELDAVMARLHREYPDAYDPGAGYKVTASPLRDALTERARKSVLLLTVTAGLVLLTACANVANLVLTRSLRRERELAIRWALGADRHRLRALLLTETAILAAAGAALGLALAYAGLDLLVSFAERFTPRAGEIRMDGGVLAFALLAASGSALVFAFVPSLRGPEEAGSSLTRTGTRATGAGQRVQRALIVAQVAATVAVLTAAGLLTRTLLRLYQVDPGVRLENTLTMEVPLQDERTPAQSVALLEEVQRRLAALPGVTEVGIGWNVPLRASNVLLELKAEGRAEEPGMPRPTAEYRTVTPEYFQAAGIPLIRGRGFAATDGADAVRVVILNRTLAERLFPGRDPVGQRIAWTGDVLRFINLSGDWRTVVGVVGDTRDAGPDAPPLPAVYQPLAQNEIGFFPGAVVIRARSAENLGPAAARLIHELIPDQPVERIATLEQIREETVAPQRLNALLVGAFGAVALAIAAVGIGGTLAFFIARRTAEIGIRMSLGADSRRVMGMVLGDGGRLLAIGLGLGLVGSALLARAIRGMLFGVPPEDPVTFLGVAALVLVVGLAACAGPALRAARVDPLVAMRAE
ncbi:MAG TPA: ABC transporter permease [Gemmatimonadales bacterium]|nr:ABC transporter permease [Gemmatimonadales bacterium]